MCKHNQTHMASHHEVSCKHVFLNLYDVFCLRAYSKLCRHLSLRGEGGFFFMILIMILIMMRILSDLLHSED